ncbi:MAG: BON domain-containing protein [Gemmataceae bacterium]
MSTSTLEQSRLTLALRHSPIPALRKLTLEESESSVIIQGQVSSYYLKQLAQESILPLLDGRQLLNRVHVVTALAMQNT